MMDDIRCKKCGTLMARAQAAGRLEFRCPARRCRLTQTIVLAWPANCTVAVKHT